MSKLKEEKTELRKQVVGDGKIAVSKKIHVRQQADLASYRKSKKRNTIKEQKVEALAPFKPDLEKIKEMMHEVNETEAAAPEVDETEAEAAKAELDVWRQEEDAATDFLQLSTGGFTEYLKPCCGSESDDSMEAEEAAFVTRFEDMKSRKQEHEMEMQKQEHELRLGEQKL